MFINWLPPKTTGFQFHWGPSEGLYRTPFRIGLPRRQESAVFIKQFLSSFIEDTAEGFQSLYLQGQRSWRKSLAEEQRGEPKDMGQDIKGFGSRSED